MSDEEFATKICELDPGCYVSLDGELIAIDGVFDIAALKAVLTSGD